MAAKLNGALASSVGLILCGKLTVLQATMFDGLSFDPFSLLDDGWNPAEVRIGICYVAQAFLISSAIVMIQECLDLGFQIAEREAFFQILFHALEI